jgi:RimJ/RimL family protein N-acetyltransferase
LTAQDSDLTIRPITDSGELGLFNRLPYELNGELDGDLRDGHRQPGWLWMALRDGHLLARAAWWGKPGGAPHALDILDIDDIAGADAVDAAGALLTTAMAAVIPARRPPDYIRFLAPDWRDEATSREATENRMAIAGRAGARFFVERLRLEWRPGTAIPAPTGRLAFRAVNGPDELLALMTQVVHGTLDAHDRDDLTRMSPQQAAAKHYDGELDRYTSPRDWWRVAELPSGEPVGFVIPADNGYSPIIAYLGVVPAQRGNGYIGEILAEGTRVLAAEDVPRIRASTDLGNVPMARAFYRAGWVTTGHQIDMTWGH